MTTQEIFFPFIVCGFFAVIGSISALTAMAIKNCTIFDADSASSKFKRTPSSKPRNRFIVMYAVAPFVCGGCWGLIQAGIFSGEISEPATYAIAIMVGIVANSIVLQVNGVKIQDIIKAAKVL